MTQRKTRGTGPSQPRRRAYLGRAAALALAGWMASTAVLARPYEGYEFAEQISLGERRLALNGLGMRAVAVFKGYLAALYLEQRSETPDGVYSQEGPKRIQLRMLLEAGAEEFVKAITKGVQRNCSESERAALGDKVDVFNASLMAVGKVRPKDLVNMDYLPGVGTVLTINGKTWGEPIAGAEFYVALLKVFLGEKPVDKRLKAGLLGQAQT